MDAETRALIEKVAKDTAERAVNDTLTKLGIDTDDPIGAQRTMVSLHEMAQIVDDPEFQKDLIQLRQWRMAVDSAGRTGIIAALGFLALGALAWIVSGFELKFMTG